MMVLSNALNCTCTVSAGVDTGEPLPVRAGLPGGLAGGAGQKGAGDHGEQARAGQQQARAGGVAVLCTVQCSSVFCVVGAGESGRRDS